MTASADPLTTEARLFLREAAGELDKAAAGESAAGNLLKSIAAHFRQVADDPAILANPVRLARDIALAARQVSDWQERRFGVETPLQRPDRNRARIDVIVDRITAVREAIARSLMPPEFLASPESAVFGSAHTKGGAVTVVVPVVDNRSSVVAVIAAVTRATNTTPVRVIAVGEGGATGAATSRLRQEVAAGRLEFLENPGAYGFAALANAGLALATGDAAILASNTLVSDYWIDRLAEVARSEPKVGSVTPLSNAAPFTAWPYDGVDNPLPPDSPLASLAADAWAGNAAASFPVPAGSSVCLYVKAPALADVGAFDAAAFGNGFAEDIDWSLRTAAKGWRHVAAPGVFVFHDTSGAFSEPARGRRARALKTLALRYPQYAGLAALHQRTDPLATARRGLDGARLGRWLEDRERVIVHLVHGWGGGVEVHATDLAARQTGEGAGAVVLKIAGPSIVRLIAPDEYPNLTFDLAKPGDVAILRRSLAADRATLHLHHVVGLGLAQVDTLTQCFADRVLTLHDFFFVTPQITLRDWTGNPCPVRPAEECDHCVSVLKPPAPFLKPVAAHRAAMAKIASGARRIFAPSKAACDLLVRGQPTLSITVAPHLDEGPIAPPRPVPAGKRTVVTIGAFNADKGALILADVIKDADTRNLPLRFVLAGQAVWRQPPPNVTVLGPYDRHSIAGILERTAGQIAFLPSIVPETYMFSLSECVRAGYYPVVFDLGAQAERVRALNWGKVLPLNTPANQIADILISVEVGSIEPAHIKDWLTRDRLPPLGYYA